MQSFWFFVAILNSIAFGRKRSGVTLWVCFAGAKPQILKQIYKFILTKYSCLGINKLISINYRLVLKQPNKKI